MADPNVPELSQAEPADDVARRIWHVCAQLPFLEWADEFGRMAVRNSTAPVRQLLEGFVSWLEMISDPALQRVLDDLEQVALLFCKQRLSPPNRTRDTALSAGERGHVHCI
jgi:hypothetical protein